MCVVQHIKRAGRRKLYGNRVVPRGAHTHRRIKRAAHCCRWDSNESNAMEEEPPTEQEVFYEISSVGMGLRDDFVEALLAAGVDTCDMLLAQHGLGGESPADAAVVALLGRMRFIEPSIDVRVAGPDATAIRGLQLKSRRISAGGSRCHPEWEQG